MPSGLRRYQQTKQLHFITFSCYRRKPKLGRRVAHQPQQFPCKKERARLGARSF
jgi:hypothetical protein